MNKTDTRLFIFAGPSGTGKTTIVRHLLNKFPSLSFSVSATTRTQRKGERHGVDYYFLSNEEFQKRINNNEFIEWEEVYEETYYGSLKSEVERLSEQGKHVVFDIDVVGGVNIKKMFGGRAVAVFIQPPSIDHLRKRLEARSTETAESLQRRIAKAQSELTFAPKFDHIVVNDDINTALTEAERIVEENIT